MENWVTIGNRGMCDVMGDIASLGLSRNFSNTGPKRATALGASVVLSSGVDHHKKYLWCAKFVFSGCNATQHSISTVPAGEEQRVLQNDTFLLPFNSTCVWNITAPEGQVVTIDIFAFNFRMPCDKEYLRIYDGPAESSDILAEYCLNSSSSRDELREYQFFSSGRSLWIETKKSINNSISGFRVSYKAMDFEGKGERHLYTCAVICTSNSPQKLNSGIF